MTTQQYDEFYWKLTLAHSDFTGSLFTGYLAKIISFIDTNQYEIAQNVSEAYVRLQAILIDDYKIDDVSVRKAINQFVKLGFVNSGLSGYHHDAKPFLKEPDVKKQMTLFSRIVYSNSSFSRSVNNRSDAKEINFFVNTLTENGGILTRDQALALMTINVSLTDAKFADNAMITKAMAHVRNTDFETRKYNQMRYLWMLLGKLDDLKIIDNKIYFSNDPRYEQVQNEHGMSSKTRDSYLQRLYKNLLIEESIKHFSAILCMVEKLDYPSLIASHIKPYAHSNEQEEFDGNNGLLLSKNMDSLFDRGFISFDDDGKILVSESRGLSSDLRLKLATYLLDPVLLNETRKGYLSYHRQHVFTT